MARRISRQHADRATRFALRFPVYFRELDSLTWLEGTTENISYTGMLFLSSSPLPPETTLELRLQLAVGTQGRDPTEIRCKGAVVRLEQRNVPETPIALAVAIRDYHIVRGHLFNESPAGNA
jgi:c-di-GMP-binding flagellar brake protein YcgR